MNLNIKENEILKTILIGLAVFFIFWYMGNILKFIRDFLKIIQPFIAGFMVAYIINIPMNFFYRLIRENYKDPQHEKTIRFFSLVLSWISIIIIGILLLNILIPQIINSAFALTRKWPQFVEEIHKLMKANSITENYADNFYEMANGVNWLSINGPLFKIIKSKDVSLFTLTSSFINSVGSSAITVFTVIVFSIFVLGKYALKALDDYKRQRKENKDPVFLAKNIGIDNDLVDFWK